jgi:CRISPR type I-E-associated protein CasB/Cse2
MSHPELVAAPAGEPPRARFRQAVHAIAKEIEDDRIPTGDQAALRREQAGPAFWRLAVRLLEPAGLLVPGDGSSARRQERRWVAIVAALARAPGSHRPGRRVGQALAEAEIAEARVLRLARAQDEALLEAVRAVAHQLATAGVRVDWSDVAELILSDGAPWQEDVRRRLFLDYYRALQRGSREETKEMS